MMRRVVIAGIVMIAALAFFALDAEAQETCMNKQLCSEPYSCWMCIDDTARGWEMVGGASNCPWCQAWECEEYGDECPLDPTPTPEVEAEVIAAWGNTTLETLNVAGREIVLFAEVSPGYPPVEDLSNYFAALGEQCRVRKAELASSVGSPAQQ